MFPIFLKLESRACLVVGAGVVAEGKIAGLLAERASLKVVAPQATAQIRQWASAGAIDWEQRTFESRDLEGMFLVIVATSSHEVNTQVFTEAHAKGILCNAVDDPPNCDFYYPAVVRRGDLQIAISTGGQSPALAQRIRQELEKQFGAEYESWVATLGKQREELAATDLDPEVRKRILHELASRASFERSAAQEGGRN
ncbi:MAG TPA: bifunctional precorrin-2 dehydrogenase/sirohydrochlorin ferrochelatase [Terriglobales bacterium]|jgi:precorrin-2 dehydrogenase/sirohydrochlorin ferrochelatase|nr:bifunctional precorrin-2 dehydrogenase/sirohydrochlorin ferrochelatase [Terriglobales bacterium]